MMKTLINFIVPMGLLCLFFNPIFANNNTSNSTQKKATSSLDDKINPCMIDYQKALQTSLYELRDQLVNHQIVIQKKENSIYCKSALNYPAKAYIGDELLLEVEDVIYYQAQILLQYNDNFYVVLDNFTDFEISEVNCEKETTEHPLASILPAIPTPDEEGVIESIVTIKYIDSQKLTQQENVNLITDTAPSITPENLLTSLQSTVITPKSAPPIITEIPIEKPQNTLPTAIPQTQLTNASKPFWLHKVRPQKSTEKLVNLKQKNPLEALWNNPVDGNFFSGCIDGKCSFNPYAAFKK